MARQNRDHRRRSVRSSARGVGDAESADLYAVSEGVVQQIERTRT
jgi:hypothetical protein